jgi:hypothetical protein
MLTLFKKIRKSILDTSSTGKYLAYAMGEIALVIIGILIALQINNWNEERKLQQKEKELLISLKSDMEGTLEKLEGINHYNDLTLKNYKEIVEFLLSDREYYPRLDTLFGRLDNWFSPFFSYNAYETVKSVGIEIITNDQIREGIIYTYEFRFPTLIEDWDKSEWSFNQVKTPLITRHLITRYWEGNIARPHNVKAMKNDPEFLSMVTQLVEWREFGVSNVARTIEELTSLISLIDEEVRKQ